MSKDTHIKIFMVAVLFTLISINIWNWLITYRINKLEKQVQLLLTLAPTHDCAYIIDKELLCQERGGLNI